MMRKWFAILYCFTSFCSSGQGIDSFPIWRQKLQDQLEPLPRRQLLLKISENYDQVNKDSSITYGLQALSWSRQLQDTPTQIYILTRLGAAYYFTGAKDKSIDYHTQALHLAEASGDETRMASSLEFISGYYMQQSDYRKALEYEQKALDHYRRSADTSRIGNMYSNLGGLYFNLEEINTALQYWLRALANEELHGYPALINLYLGNIAAAYSLLGQVDKAAVYYHCQLDQSRELNDSLALAQCYQSLGSFYEAQSDYNAAIRYYESAISIFKKVNSKDNLIASYDGLSEVYKGLHQYEKAMTNNKMAIALVRLFGQEIIYNYLWEKQSLILERLLQPDKALASYKQFILYRDSSINVEKKTAFARQEIQDDFDKQAYADSLSHASEMNINQLKLQRQRLYTFSGVSGLILVLTTLVLLYRSYRQKQKTNRELAIAKERAEQSEKFKQQFLANMSHEIRTPLNAVMGMTNLALETPLDPKQKNYLTGIKRASSNLLHIINDILDLSKVEAGKMELEHIDFSIREVVKQVHELLVQTANEKGIDLKTVTDTDVPEVVIGDPNRLNQVILNLAGNAIKFTEKGSVTIQVSKIADQDIIHFSIVDTGIGIPKEKQDQIFESFTQIHSSDSRRYGGTGLGLTISRQFIELMGGTLSVKSEAGKGSTFSFEVPLPPGSVDQLVAPSNEQIDFSILNGLRILLADDHENNRTVAVDTLHSKSEVEIAEATNGQEVLDLLHQKDFDVILMDVQMPILDGYETTRQIRSTFTSPKNQIPIIALTASVIRSDLDKCREAGMNDYVPKPFTTSELILAIAKATGRKIQYLTEETQAATTAHLTWSGTGQHVDLRHLAGFCGGDKMKMQKYITIFIDYIPLTIVKIKDSIAVNDMNGIASQLHGIRTQLSMMGMRESLTLAGNLEISIRNESISFTELKPNLELLLQQMEMALTELRVFS